MSTHCTDSRRTRRPSLRRRLVRLAERATTPLLPADYLDLFDPLRRGADLRGRIVAVQPETADAATIVIRPGADWAGHVPGQYVRIGIDVDGVRQWRAYSLTHGPRADGQISITVKAVPDGKVSNHLVRRRPAGHAGPPRAGSRASSCCRPTAGSCCSSRPAPASRRSSGCCATSSRSPTPAWSGWPAAAATTSPSCTWRRASPTRSSSPTSARSTTAGLIRLVARYNDVHGVLDVDDLTPWCPTCTSGTTFACGPAACSTRSQQHHEPHGLPLLTEQFRTSAVVAGEGGTVTFARSGATVRPTAGTPILDAAEEAGVLMPSGCRMGICYGCVLPMREGAVRDLRTGEITTATPGETGERGVPIQTCISAAAGACDIDH